MKLTTIVSATLLALSASTIASDAIQQLSVTSIKHTLSPQQIQAELDNWYQSELTNVDEVANRMSDRVPLIVRKQQARDRLEQQYANLKADFGL
jgi:acyl carrier protein phosphodiesterase